MAVSVNTVYQTVLYILNKEQRGYITPSEFNSIAEQVQDEIFQSYFPDGNQQNRKNQKTLKMIQSFLIFLKIYHINYIHLNKKLLLLTTKQMMDGFIMDQKHYTK
jgi:hypothetical protein